MKLLFLSAAGAAAILAAAPAGAQQSAAAAPAEPKISQVIVYGDDACPPSTDDVIVVCAKKPETERYRIPENLRGNPNDPANQAWATRATELQYVGRSGIGSCSTTGPGGMIGCFNDIVRQARAERGSRDEINWEALIADARRERLGKIDAAAEEEEAAQKEREAGSPR